MKRKKQIMRRWSWAALLLFTISAHAAEPTRAGVTEEMREAAAALVQTLGSEGTTRHMLEVMKGQIETLIVTKNPGADARKALDEIIMPELRHHLGELTTAIADVWASRLSVAELKELRAFYETPLGAKAVRVLPQIMAEARTASNTWAKNVFRDILDKHGEELKALGITPSR